MVSHSDMIAAQASTVSLQRIDSTFLSMQTESEFTAQIAQNG